MSNKEILSQTAAKIAETSTSIYTLVILGLLALVGAVLSASTDLGFVESDEVIRAFILVSLSEMFFVLTRIAFRTNEILSRVRPDFELLGGPADVKSKVLELARDRRAKIQEVKILTSGLRYSAELLEQLQIENVGVRILCTDPKVRHLFISDRARRGTEERIAYLSSQGHGDCMRTYQSQPSVRAMLIEASPPRPSYAILGWYINCDHNRRQDSSQVHILVSSQGGEEATALFDFARRVVDGHDQESSPASANRRLLTRVLAFLLPIIFAARRAV